MKDNGAISWWYVFIIGAVILSLGILLGGLILNPGAYKRGQIDAIEGRIKYEYVKVKGE